MSVLLRHPAPDRGERLPQLGSDRAGATTGTLGRLRGAHNLHSVVLVQQECRWQQDLGAPSSGIAGPSRLYAQLLLAQAVHRTAADIPVGTQWARVMTSGYFDCQQDRVELPGAAHEHHRVRSFSSAKRSCQ